MTFAPPNNFRDGRKSSQPRDPRIVWVMGLPVFTLLLFFIVPIMVMATYSFQTGTLGSGFTWSLDTIRDFANAPAYHRLLWQSCVMAAVTAAICVLFSYPIAYYLVFHAGSHRLTLLTIIIVPAWTSYLLRILAWKLILGSNGILNLFLLGVGLMDAPSPLLLFSRAAVIVTLVYVWIPFVTLPIFATLDRIDKRLLEASADLGGTHWTTFWRITLPLSMYGVIAGFLSVFIPTLGEYVTPLLVGGVDGVMYGNIINDQFVRALNWPLGAVMSFVLLIVLVPFFVIFSRVEGRRAL